ncbi:MAG: hypothetical protein KatS3mg101_0894 [Patescibacteria group bacterium]|nr:MAG: hypothetical protein KatS3mg101_0894 [Patescibacteria group bacterium]
MEISEFITWDKFDIKRMVKTEPETRTSKARQDPNNPSKIIDSVQYQILPIKYEYDKEVRGEKVKVVAPLAVELPKLRAPSGIIRRKSMYGNGETAHVFTIFDMSNEDCAKLCSLDKNSFWTSLYDWFVNRLWELRSQIPSVKKLPSKEAMPGMFAFPIYYPRDPNTSEVIKGSNPSKYMPLRCFGEPGTPKRRECVFKAPVEDKTGEPFKTIPWEILESASFEYIPIVVFKQLYIGGGKVVMQYDVISAVVTSITPIGTRSLQTETLNKYKENKEVYERLKREIEYFESGFRRKEDDNVSLKQFLSESFDD